MLRYWPAALAVLAAVGYYFVAHQTPITGTSPLLHFGIQWGFTEEEIPDLSGKVALVTGANVGLGRGTAQLLAKHNAEVHITCRSQSKCDQAVKDILSAVPSGGVGSASCSVVELSSLKSVAEFAEQFSPSKIDILILNAGVMACPFNLTEDGIEWQFAVNHLAHFLLAQGLLPRVEAAAAATGDARVVAVSSIAHYRTPDKGIGLTLEEVNNAQEYLPESAYGQSKLANLLFATELQRRMDEKGVPVFVNAVHPGGVQGNLIKNTAIYKHTEQKMGTWFADLINDILLLAYWSEQTGALTSLFPATSPKVPQGAKGKYFVPIARVWPPSSDGQNATLAKALWDFSEELLVSKGFGA